MKKFMKVTAGILIVLILLIGAGVLYIKYKLPNASDPPDIKVPLTAENIARGKYLTNYVAVCKDCHSKRDVTKFAMPVIESTNFGGGDIFDETMGLPGTLISPNITPYKLKTWTDGEIYRAITTGVTKSRTALFPFMPYPHYGQLDERDVFAIIAYLRTLPEVKNDPERSSLNFPVSLLVNTMTLKANLHPRPDTTDKIAYGKYIVNTAGCIECHSQKSGKGELIKGMEFAGGFKFKVPTGTLHTSNLTPDKMTGLGGWTEEAFVARFSQYDSSYVPVDAGNGFNTLMPWILYGKMNKTDLRAIYAYLHSLTPVKNEVIKFAAN